MSTEWDIQPPYRAEPGRGGNKYFEQYYSLHSAFPIRSAQSLEVIIHTPGHKHHRAGPEICLAHWMHQPHGAGHRVKDRLSAHKVNSHKMSMGSGIKNLQQNYCVCQFLA